MTKTQQIILQDIVHQYTATYPPTIDWQTLHTPETITLIPIIKGQINRHTERYTIQLSINHEGIQITHTSITTIGIKETGKHSQRTATIQHQIDIHNPNYKQKIQKIIDRIIKGHLI